MVDNGKDTYVITLTAGVDNKGVNITMFIFARFDSFGTATIWPARFLIIGHAYICISIHRFDPLSTGYALRGRSQLKNMWIKRLR